MNLLHVGVWVYFSFKFKKFWNCLFIYFETSGSRQYRSSFLRLCLRRKEMEVAERLTEWQNMEANDSWRGQRSAKWCVNKVFVAFWTFFSECAAEPFVKKNNNNKIQVVTKVKFHTKKGFFLSGEDAAFELPAVWFLVQAFLPLLNDISWKQIYIMTVLGLVWHKMNCCPTLHNFWPIS